MRALVSVAGHDLPDPSEYSATTSTVVDSARNVEGKMIGAVIRSGIVKAEMTWKYITAEKWAEILNLFEPSKGGSFINDVTLYLQDINDWETHSLYVSDRTAKMFLRRKDGSVRGWLDARIALIEV